jgi:hypothetical protein
MNKWQIICPVVAMIIAVMTIGVITGGSERRSFIGMASRSIGQDLIHATNSSHLVRVGPDLQERLAGLLGLPTHISTVLFGDEPPPNGNGGACSRLVLTNTAGQGVLIRLQQADNPGMFRILGFQSVTNHL